MGLSFHSYVTWSNYGAAVKVTCSTHCRLSWTGQPGPWQGTTASILFQETTATCNWFSVRQHVFYQTVIMMHNTMKTGLPMKMKHKKSSDFPYRTGQATNRNIRYGQIDNTKSSLSQSSFAYRELNDYNMIPANIRACKTMATSELEKAARATCGACSQFFVWIEDIFSWKSRTFVAILNKW